MRMTRHDFAGGLYRFGLGLALVLLPMRVLAFDFTPDASRVISDPAYLPLGAQIFGATEFTLGEANSNTNNHLGVLLSSNNTAITSINQLLDYGITDDLTLRVSGFFQLLGSTNSPPSGASTITTSDGLGDPTISAVWRVLDQKDKAFNWDLIGSYAPNLISAQSATPELNGTVARGGAMADFSTALSYKTKSFTIYGEFSGDYLGARTTLNQSNNITTSYDSNWQYAFYITTQTRFNEVFSLNAGVSQTFTGDADASFTNSSGKLIDFTSQPGNITTLVGALNYQLTPGRFVASAIYTHDFYGNSASTYATVPNNDTTTVDRNADTFGGEVRYVFN